MELDDVLKVLVHDTKMEAVHILADDDKGRLGKVFPLDDLAPEDWIDGLIEKTECAEKYPLLMKALTSLKNFTINVQGFLIYEVRRNLDVIDFSLQPQMPEISAPLADREGVAEEITSWLNYYAEQFFDGIGTTLNNLSSVPNKAEFAALKDFYDRATYAGRDENLDVLTQRRYLYEDWMSVIWADKYNAHFAQQQQAQEWEDMTANFKAHNKAEFNNTNLSIVAADNDTLNTLEEKHREIADYFNDSGHREFQPDDNPSLGISEYKFKIGLRNKKTDSIIVNFIDYRHRFAAPYGGNSRRQRKRRRQIQ